MFKRLPFHTLAARMNFVLISILFCITLALGFTVYEIAKITVENAAIRRLEALAESQKTAIENQLHSYSSQVNIIMKSDMLSMHIPFISGEESESEYSYESLSAGLRRKKAAMPDIVQIDILGKDHMIKSSTNSEVIGHKVELDKKIEDGWHRLMISDIFLDKGDYYIDICAPIVDYASDPQALLYVHFDAKEMLHITGNYAGLGDSGESLLGVREGEFIQFITPLRFAPDLSQIKPLPMEGKLAEPMIHATLGQTGTVTSLDYRGVEVVAAYRQLDLTGWGLVVKQDEAEVFKGIYRLQTGLVISVFLFFLLGLAVTLPLVREFIRPINELTDATQKVIDGDLNVRVPVHGSDEIGELAAAFNAMTIELQNTQTDLIRRNEELSSFAYVVSHDLKAPLRGIHSLSGWLGDDLKGILNDEQLSQFQLLRDRVLRMDALIDGLLEYSRAGQKTTGTNLVDVTKLIEHIIAIFHVPEDFEIIISDSLPVITTDELHLSQVFQNLIDNAIKHHPGPNGKIEIDCRELEDAWEFSVHDDGNGIDPRYHERIFNIFQTLRSDKNEGSTGIGLALVKKIVKNQGGVITLESEGETGKGATFKFTWLKE